MAGCSANASTQRLACEDLQQKMLPVCGSIMGLQALQQEFADIRADLHAISRELSLVSVCIGQSRPRCHLSSLAKTQWIFADANAHLRIFTRLLGQCWR